MSLLSLSDLKTHFFTDEGVVRAVDGLSLSIDVGEVLCLVGESGSGKSVAALSILGLVPDPPGRIVGGEILFRATEQEAREDLATASEQRLRQIRGDRIAMIFQDPMTSLNPYLKVSTQLCEVLEIHQALTGTQARKRAISMLDDVGFPSAEARIDDYPHQLSGGMRQRVMIAMALLCQPALLLADEPTTALDVTIQAQILDLIDARRRDLGLAVLLITHDLGVVARMADRVAVMYAGRAIEQGGVEQVFAQPLHPYTLALQRSVPRVDSDASAGPLKAIEGLPPTLVAIQPGCPFAPRCAYRQAICTEQYPSEKLVPAADDDGYERRVSCHLDLREVER